MFKIIFSDADGTVDYNIAGYAKELAFPHDPNTEGYSQRWAAEQAAKHSVGLINVSRRMDYIPFDSDVVAEVVEVG